MIAAAASSSSAEVTSSQISTRRSAASALATATRWRRPPDSSCGQRSANAGDMPTNPTAEATRWPAGALRLAADSPCRRPYSRRWNPAFQGRAACGHRGGSPRREAGVTGGTGAEERPSGRVRVRGSDTYLGRSFGGAPHPKPPSPHRTAVPRRDLRRGPEVRGWPLPTTAPTRNSRSTIRPPGGRTPSTSAGVAVHGGNVRGRISWCRSRWVQGRGLGPVRLLATVPGMRAPAERICRGAGRSRRVRRRGRGARVHPGAVGPPGRSC